MHAVEPLLLRAFLQAFDALEPPSPHLDVEDNEDDKELSTAEIEFLNKSHFKKIEISDAVYIVNINEYIGEQVKKEIAYAKKLGKEVILHTNFIN